MRHGLSVPNFGDYADARAIATLAADAERAGWDGLFVWDHVLGWSGNEVGDPWTSLTAAAIATERIRLGTMVTPLARRRPWQVVRQVVSLDRLSNGRAVLGVGLGEPAHEEFGVFGEPEHASTRAAILDESLEVVTGLMSGEATTFRGQHVRVDDVVFAPRPIQRPRVPIWVGGAWPHRAPFRRAARFDGVVPSMAAGPDGFPPEMTVETMESIVAFIRDHRPNEEPFDVVFLVGGTISGGDTHALDAIGVTWCVSMPAWPDEGADAFRRRVASGPLT